MNKQFVLGVLVIVGAVVGGVAWYKDWRLPVGIVKSDAPPNSNFEKWRLDWEKQRAN